MCRKCVLELSPFDGSSFAVEWHEREENVRVHEKVTLYSAGSEKSEFRIRGCWVLIHCHSDFIKLQDKRSTHRMSFESKEQRWKVEIPLEFLSEENAAENLEIPRSITTTVILNQSSSEQKFCQMGDFYHVKELNVTGSGGGWKTRMVYLLPSSRGSTTVSWLKRTFPMS